jgi:CRP/FNR family transcriptional regulator
MADGFAAGFLANLESSVLEDIRRRASVHHHRVGDIVVSEADGPWTGIVLSGMARVFLRTSGGRQVTMRHARAGESIGIGAVLGEGAVSAQAVTDCVVMKLDRGHLLRLAEERPAVAMAIARELSVRLIETYREIAIREQGSVRQRLARQLLHLAGVSEPRDLLRLSTSHEELAEAVGSAREVVSRHLERFQVEGMVELERGRITIVEPNSLEIAARRSV